MTETERLTRKREYDARYRARNRETLAAKTREYIERLTAEGRPPRHSKAPPAAAMNPEQLAARRASYDRYHATHQEQMREARRERARRNPEKVSEWNRRRRARKLGARVGRVSYAEILGRDGLTCHLCGGAVSNATLSFDHVVPLARGGAHSMDNIKVAHLSCNSRKGARAAA